MDNVRIWSFLQSAETREQVSSWIEKLEAEGYQWQSIGGRRNNRGPIEVSADPSEALNERITNAIDAVLEREWSLKHQSEPQPNSPREAAEKWFGIEGGSLSKLSKTERRKLAERIKVTLLESTVEKAPTVVVQDEGIGQHPENFPSTLLSLNEENKINKFFLMGSYGQGGAAVYAFCEYTIIISRLDPKLLEEGKKDQVGWTIVRYNPLDAEHRNGSYQYLVRSDGKIPFINSTEADDYRPGTQIRMIQYELPKHFTIFTALSNSLWALTNSVLYDPVLPFLIADERISRFKSLKERSVVQRTRVILGVANRLRIRTKGKAEDEDGEEGEDESDIRYGTEEELDMGDYGTIQVRYWVFGFPKKPRKSAPVDSYSDSQSAVAVTLNGQRQAKFDRSYFRTELDRPILKDFMLIQIDGDKLTKLGKRALFSSTRDRVHQGTFLESVLAETRDIITNDIHIQRIAVELQEAALKSASSEENMKLSRQLEALIKEYSMKDKATAVGLVMLHDKDGLPTVQALRRTEEVEAEEDEERKKIQAPEPRTWAGKYYPTIFDFAVARDPLRIPIGKTYSLLFKTDAQDDCLDRALDQGKLEIKFDPPESLLLKSLGHMRGGMVSRRVIATDSTWPGGRVKITATLTFPGKKPLTAQRNGEFVSTHRGARKPAQVEGPPKYLIVPVERTEEAWITDKGEKVPLDTWTLDNVAMVDPAQDRILIYVNMSNTDYIEAVRKRNVTPEQIERYKDRYKIAIAFHCYMQDRSMKELEKDKVPSSEALEAELRRTVRTVIFTTFSSPQQEILASASS